MVMRNILCVGDPPVTGGAVLPYDAPYPTRMTDALIPVALIGGSVFCKACKSTGIIAKAGGMRRINFMTEIALDGDVCVCNCHPPPPIKATIALTAWHEDEGEAIPAEPPRTFNQHFQIVHEETGKPLKNHDYRILHNGEIIEGTTDEDGLTKIVYFNSASNIEIQY